jgi:hypothetical protein
MPKHCSECRWHFAHAQAIEQAGWKNCLALPYPACTVFYTTPAAVCSFPELFQPQDNNDRQESTTEEVG